VLALALSASSVSPPSSLAFWPQGQFNDCTPKTEQGGRFVLGDSNWPAIESRGYPADQALSAHARPVPDRAPPGVPRDEVGKGIYVGPGGIAVRCR
jgi:hypothetical protein